MLMRKRIRITDLLMLAGLAILPILLAACQTTADSSAAPVGLSDTEMEAVVEMDVVGLGAVAGQNDDGLAESWPAESVAGERLETASEVVTVEIDDVRKPARPADSSLGLAEPASGAVLSAAEIEGLAYMREEEKLARDVYLALYELWGLPIFQNIAGSEQAHMDSILLLLDQDNLADPAAGLGAGEFSLPLFQSMYLELVAQGSASPAAALTVGGTIEELDIADLQLRSSQTTNEAILQVYTNLLAGSENHLRAFVSTLERQSGEVYQPVYLDPAAYQTIISGTNMRGNGNTGGNGYGRGNSGGRNGNSWQNSQDDSA